MNCLLEKGFETEHLRNPDELSHTYSINAYSIPSSFHSYHHLSHSLSPSLSLFPFPDSSCISANLFVVDDMCRKNFGGCGRDPCIGCLECELGGGCGELCKLLSNILGRGQLIHGVRQRVAPVCQFQCLSLAVIRFLRKR